MYVEKHVFVFSFPKIELFFLSLEMEEGPTRQYTFETWLCPFVFLFFLVFFMSVVLDAFGVHYGVNKRRSVNKLVQILATKGSETFPYINTVHCLLSTVPLPLFSTTE